MQRFTIQLKFRKSIKLGRARTPTAEPSLETGTVRQPCQRHICNQLPAFAPPHGCGTDKLKLYIQTHIHTYIMVTFNCQFDKSTVAAFPNNSGLFVLQVPQSPSTPCNNALQRRICCAQLHSVRISDAIKWKLLSFAYFLTLHTHTYCLIIFYYLYLYFYFFLTDQLDQLKCV